MENDLTVSNLPNILKSSRNNNDDKYNNISLSHRNKNNLLLKNYFHNSYILETQAIRNSCGKMILSKSQSSPSFSFGKEKRFYQEFSKEEINLYGKLFNKIRNQNSKKGILLSRVMKHRNYQDQKNYLGKIRSIKLKSPSEFLYCLPPTNLYKYPILPRFSFGKGLRDLQKPIKKYEFYKLNYDKRLDEENVEKKWRNRIVGGNIGIEDRFVEDKKYYYDSILPGPGKYNPDYESFKYKQNKYGYMGIKLSEDHNNIKTDRPKKISLNAYNIKHLIGSKSYNDIIKGKSENKISIKNIGLKLVKLDKNIKQNEFLNMKKLFKNKLSSLNNSTTKNTSINT